MKIISTVTCLFYLMLDVLATDQMHGTSENSNNIYPSHHDTLTDAANVVADMGKYDTIDEMMKGSRNLADDEKMEYAGVPQGEHRREQAYYYAGSSGSGSEDYYYGKKGGYGKGYGYGYYGKKGGYYGGYGKGYGYYGKKGGYYGKKGGYYYGYGKGLPSSPSGPSPSWSKGTGKGNGW